MKGTPKDMRKSGLNRKGKEAKVPVFVWSVLSYEDGGAMTVETMKKDPQVRTGQSTRTKEPMSLFGSAGWRCPAFDEAGLVTSRRQGVQICCSVRPEAVTALAALMEGLRPVRLAEAG